MQILTHHSQIEIQPECNFHIEWTVSDREGENVKYVQMPSHGKNLARLRHEQVCYTNRTLNRNFEYTGPIRKQKEEATAKLKFMEPGKTCSICHDILQHWSKI